MADVAGGTQFLDNCTKVDDTHYNCDGTTYVPKSITDDTKKCVEYSVYINAGVDSYYDEQQSCGRHHHFGQRL